MRSKSQASVKFKAKVNKKQFKVIYEEYGNNLELQEMFCLFFCAMT